MATIEEKLNSTLKAHIMDAKGGAIRYSSPNLKTEVSSLSNFKLARGVLSEYQVITRELKNHLLSCPHPVEHRIGDSSFENCQQCGCTRRSKYREHAEDSNYYERCTEIIEQYQAQLSPVEFKILDDFNERRINFTNNSFQPYNEKMKEIFNKYPIWNEWVV